MKRIAALIPAAVILILLAAACAAPEPVIIVREVTVVATLTPAPPEPTPGSTQRVIAIIGDVTPQFEASVADLQALGVVRIVAEHPTQGRQEYSGVRLTSLLEKAKVGDGPLTLGFTASDGFYCEAVLSDMSDCSDCLLAIGDDGRVNAVMPGFSSEAWVKDVVSVRIKLNQISEPSAVPSAETPQEGSPYDLTILSKWADYGYLVYFQISAADTHEAEKFRQAAFEYLANEFAASYPDMEIVAPEDLRSISRQLMDCMGLNSSDLSVFVLPVPNDTDALDIVEAVRLSASSELAARWYTQPMAGRACVPQYGSEFEWLVLTYKGDIGSNADGFVRSVIERFVEWIPEFQTASYWPDLLRSVHNFGIAYCFPRNPGEFNVAIRFRPENTTLDAIIAPGLARYEMLAGDGGRYGILLDHVEFVPGEQCVVRK